MIYKDWQVNSGMDFRCIFIFLIFANAILAATTCIGYSESFDARVLDAKFRAVEGAEVWIKFDRGTSFGDKYFTTEPRLTDSDGMVHFTIQNMGTNTRTIDCKIVVTGSMGGSTVSETITVDAHGNPVDVQLDIHKVRFYVRDKKKGPVENATITLGDMTFKTNVNGVAVFYYKAGEYDCLVSYLDAKQTGTLLVEDDLDYEVLFIPYKIQVDVIDDTGVPLDVSLQIFNETFELDEGHFEYERSFGNEIDYVVDYKGVIKTGTIETAAETSAMVVYDVHAPVFGTINTGMVNERMRLTVPITDPGMYASGVDVPTMKATYKVEPADGTSGWNTATTYATAHDMYAVDFPELAANSIVDFKLEVKDREGNRAEIQGKFSTLASVDGSGTGGTTDNNTTNQTNPPETGQEEQEIPLIYIVGGVILVLLGIYLVFRIKSMGS